LKGDGINSEVLKNFEETLQRLQDLGYEIVDIELPHVALSLPVYYILTPAEASTNLARFDGVRYGRHEEGEDLIDTYFKSKRGFGPEVRRRILLGTYVLSAGYKDAYYTKANNVRALIRKEFEDIFHQVDSIVTPTAPSVAFRFGEKSDPVTMYVEDLFTVPINITNVPAMSIPSGVNSEGLPIGFQIIAPHFHEHLLFEVGKKLGV
jgi:aspartyl-tRNA(Asn)/glutamyl-tRNA(Gln) amidotransferase subunit A